MWRGVAVLVAIMLGVVLLASGCGTIEVSDPFTGSWSPSGQAPATTIIAPSGDGYRATLLAYGEPLNTLSLKRNGDQLEATVTLKEPSPSSWTVVVERREGSDRLFWIEGGSSMPLTRVSDSTALPSASPTAP